MTAKTRPIPPANRSTKGPGGHAHKDVGDESSSRPINPEKQGQSANTKINTTNQGLQQDR